MLSQLATASLSVNERALLERFAAKLQAELGEELHAVWLFGSRARGEPPKEHSDVDVLVLVDDATWKGKTRVYDALVATARAAGVEALTWSFSLHINTPEWLARRREIESFFIAEVDRDKIAVCGSVV
jgi:hypothetical protein